MNKYTAATLDVARRVKRLVKKYHPDLAKARVRIDCVFVTTDGEDGAPVKVNGYPALAAASTVPQKYRPATKADARITIDKEAFEELTDKQKDALLDHELQHFQAVIDENTVALDGNDRPRIRMRKHDVQIGFFSVIAQRHGENSQEVIACRALVEHAAEVYLPGFEFAAKALPGQRKAVKALPAKQPGNVIDLPQPEKAAAK